LPHESDYCKKKYYETPEGKALHMPEVSMKNIFQFPARNIEEILDMLLFADKYMLDLTNHQDDIIFNGYMICWQKKSIQVWKDNEELLSCTESVDFNKIHFVAPPVLVNPNYALPQANLVNYYEYHMQEYDPRKSEMTQEQVNMIITCLLDMNLIILLKMFVISLAVDIQHCHMLLVSGRMEEICIIVPEMEKYLFYTMRVLFLEEKTKYSRASGGDRYLIKINSKSNSVSKLFQYKFSSINPYIPCMITGLMGYSKQPVEPCFLFGERGIHNYKKFKKRLNIYTGGILKGLDWTKSALCGSTMTACLIINPLENNFSSFEKYIDEYYPGKPIKKRLRNVRNSNSQCVAGSYTDIDIMIETTDFEEFDKIVKEHYEIIKHNFAVNKRTKCIDSVLELVCIKTENKYKYRITGLPREIEFFTVNSIPGVISKFHLGCVRAYYTGNKVMIFPTFITAAYTGINIDMRWVSCNKNLRDILMKYYQRGFGFIVNQKEKTLLIDYLNKSEMWPSPADEDKSGVRGRRWHFRRERPKSLLFNISKKIFCPSRYKCGVGYGIKQPTNYFVPNFVIPLRNIHAELYVSRSERRGSTLEIMV
jgi:hypothetical protein